MIKTAVTAAVMTVASMALVGSALAAGAAGREADGTGNFYATPIQKGAPTDLPGERLVPGASQAAGAIDLVVSPVLVPINQVGTEVGGTVGTVVAAADPTPAAAPPAAAPAKARRHHHHHHHAVMKHHMKKKHM